MIGHDLTSMQLAPLLRRSWIAHTLSVWEVNKLQESLFIKAGAYLLISREYRRFMLLLFSCINYSRRLYELVQSCQRMIPNSLEGLWAALYYLSMLETRSTSCLHPDIVSPFPSLLLLVWLFYSLLVYAITDILRVVFPFSSVLFFFTHLTSK